MITFRNVKGFFDTVHNADTVGQLKQMRQVIDEKIVIMERKENVTKENVVKDTLTLLGELVKYRISIDECDKSKK